MTRLNCLKKSTGRNFFSRIIFRNFRKSSQILPNPHKASPRCLYMASWRRLFTKRGDLHETSVFTMFEAHSAGPRSPLGYSFGPQSRPKGAPMPLLGRLGRGLKFNVFLEGSRCSLLLQNVIILGPPGINFWTPC